MGKKQPKTREKKLAFVVTPIGDDYSSVRRATDGLVDCVLTPVLEERGYEVKVAHRMSDGGSITDQVISNVIESDLVIANLTNLNPNVMYELAIRHSFGKKVVILAKTDTKLPFDVAEERTVFYTDDLFGATELKERLNNAVLSAEEADQVNNPVKRAFGVAELWKEVEASDNPTLSLLLNEISQMKKGISAATTSSEEERDYLTSQLIGTKWNVSGFGMITFVSAQIVELQKTKSRKGWVAIDGRTIVWGDNYRLTRFSAELNSFTCRELRGNDSFTAKRIN